MEKMEGKLQRGCLENLTGNEKYNYCQDQRKRKSKCTEDSPALEEIKTEMSNLGHRGVTNEMGGIRRKDESHLQKACWRMLPEDEKETKLSNKKGRKTSNKMD